MEENLMKNFGKKIKRAIATLIMLSVASTCFIYVSAAPIEENSIIAFADFESDKWFTNQGTSLENVDGLYGTSLKVIPQEKESFASREVYLEDSVEEYTVSFDFKADQTDHNFCLLLRDSMGKDFSNLFFDHYGNVIVTNNGRYFYSVAYKEQAEQYEGTSFTALGSYDTNWHSVSVRIVPNGDSTKLYWYYDGEFVFEADTSRQDTKKDQQDISGILKSMYVLSLKNGLYMPEGSSLEYDGTESFYFDNFIVSKTGGEYFSGTATGSDKTVNIVVSEQLSDSYAFNNMKFRNMETGEYTDVVAADCGYRTAVLTLADSLVGNTEYRIVSEDTIESSTGRLLGDISFVADNFKKAPIGTVIYNGSNEEPLIFDNSQKKTIDIDIDEEKIISGESVVVGYDLTLSNPSQSNLKIYIMNNNGSTRLAAAKVANADGDFAVHKSVIPWLDDAVADSGYFVAKEVLASGQKAHIDMIIDAVTKKVSYYINNKFLGTVNSVLSGNDLVPTQIIFATASQNENKILSDVTVENLMVGHLANQNKVLKFRVQNRTGEVFGPYSNEVISTATKATVYFNCEVDPSTLDESTIIISDGASYTVGDYDYEKKSVDIYFDEFLIKDHTYMVTVDGVFDSDEVPVVAYTTEFKTSDEAKFLIEDIRLENASNQVISGIDDINEGDSLYLHANILNYTDDPEKIRCFVVAENNGVMTDMSETLIEIPANTQVTDIYLEEPVGVLGIIKNNLRVTAMITDENYMPITDAILLPTEIDVVEDEWQIKLDRTTTHTNEKVFVDVFLPDKDYDDIEGAPEISEVLAYRTQYVTDNEGKYSVNFRLFDDPDLDNDAISGEYRVISYFEDGTNDAEKIVFSNVREVSDTLKKINSLHSTGGEDKINKIAETITDKAFALELNQYDFFSKTDCEKVALIIDNYLYQNGEFVASNTTAGIEIIKKAMIFAAATDEYIENILDYSKELKLDESEIKDFWKKDYVQKEYNDGSFKKLLTSFFKGKSVTTIPQGYDILTEAFVLTTVEKPDGLDNATDIIRAFSSKIGTGSTGSTSAYRTVAYQKYLTYEALKEAFDNANSGGGSTSGGGGSSGGGSTSGGGGSIGGTKVNDLYGGTSILTPDKPEEINLDIYDDLDGYDWAKEAIVALSERKILHGKGNGLFAPGDVVTREELAKMIVMAFVDKAEEKEITFSDISEKDWSYEYIKKAYSAGIIKGYSDTIFGPKDGVTRQDVAVMLYRTAQIYGIRFDEGSVHFADEDSISEYAVEAVNAMHGIGFINGMGDNNFVPMEKASRAQVAKIIYAMLNY